MSKEVDTYKIFRKLEERKKRTNPYKFYDKDELIDEILKDEDEIERLNNIIEIFEEKLERGSNMKEEYTCLEHNTFIDIKNTLKSVLKRFQELKGSNLAIPPEVIGTNGEDGGLFDYGDR